MNIFNVNFEKGHIETKIEKLVCTIEMVQIMKCLQTMNFLPRNLPKNNFNPEAFEVRPPESL